MHDDHPCAHSPSQVSSTKCRAGHRAETRQTVFDCFFRFSSVFPCFSSFFPVFPVLVEPHTIHMPYLHNTCFSVIVVHCHMMCCTAFSVEQKGHTLRAGHRAETRKHGSGAPLSSFPLLLVVVLSEHGGCLSFVDRDCELRIWNEREARRNERETRCWLTLERVRNSLLESFQSRRLSLVAGRDAKVTNWTDPLTLKPWLWRANRLNHYGRCSASFATTNECSDESECCT